MQTASKITWHRENYERRKMAGELRHPYDGMFDSMEHVVVHLAHEARLGGPVQYR
jgi:hypothetical protein